MKRLLLSCILVLAVMVSACANYSNIARVRAENQRAEAEAREALKRYRPAAEQGDANAQFHLGVLYFAGQGVWRNHVEAMKWYRLAAEQGHAEAQEILGILYDEGEFVPQDYAKAAKWYRLAAEQGYEEAKKALKTLEPKLARQNQKKPSPPTQSAATKSDPTPKSFPPTKTGTSGSGFFVSKLGHIVTNEHVVKNCQSITVGDNAKKQVTVTLVETDKRNDLALLKISSTKMASADTKSLISKLGISIVPLASDGLLRSDDVELGEDVLVAGYPYGDIFSNTIKVTKGIVSANRGMGDDTGQFQMDAAVQSGNSGGPIYDENGNIVGVVVAQLNRLKVAKAIGSLPENVNFGIKASTVRQFLTSSGLPTKWSKKSKRMSTKNLAKVAKNQTVMVVCNP